MSIARYESRLKGLEPGMRPEWLFLWVELPHMVDSNFEQARNDDGHPLQAAM